mmetsp:Transcript_94176/g.245689  ORF Transcript_94176/g.245689 Transcript_94176/m.245689 type:complete len:308 (-) Transcript_94176:194-1117(-)
MRSLAVQIINRDLGAKQGRGMLMALRALLDQPVELPHIVWQHFVQVVQARHRPAQLSTCLCCQLHRLGVMLAVVVLYGVSKTFRWQRQRKAKVLQATRYADVVPRGTAPIVAFRRNLRDERHSLVGEQLEGAMHEFVSTTRTNKAHVMKLGSIQLASLLDDTSCVHVSVVVHKRKPIARLCELPRIAYDQLDPRALWQMFVVNVHRLDNTIRRYRRRQMVRLGIFVDKEINSTALRRSQGPGLCHGPGLGPSIGVLVRNGSSHEETHSAVIPGCIRRNCSNCIHGLAEAADDQLAEDECCLPGDGPN